jgi:hypothetical protein
VWAGLKGGLLAAGAALAASVCCLLPLTLVLLGLSSGAFMATTMPYRWLLVPLGVAGLLGGYGLYAGQRRHCAAAGCRVAGGWMTLILLVLATLVVLGEVAVTFFPEAAARALAGPPGHAGGHASHDRP